VLREVVELSTAGRVDVAWLVRQVKGLHRKGRSVVAIVAALNAVSVRRGDGSEIQAADVKRWLAAE